MRPSSFAEDLNKAAFAGRPQDYVMATAEHKARHICHELANGDSTRSVDNKTQLVLACDTVVTVDNEIIEKPTDRDDAFSMLQRCVFLMQ